MNKAHAILVFAAAPAGCTAMAADRSYLVGTSNGVRHGFVSAARLPGEYDGILVSTPSWRLPLAATALAA